MRDLQFVQDLFERSVDLDASQRARFLVEQTNGDEGLARQVERLVAADARTFEGLTRTAADYLVALREGPPAQELCGVTFGSYVIEEYLSSGGMGHVYRAKRTSAGAERRVALKVLRPGLDTDEFLRRFDRERQTLAGLEHDNIVTFVDAGALPDGRPYLVMEYVEGKPLTDWAHEVSLRERLSLFRQVLSAVQYAHRQLVVHRDLKPSNVLVTAQGSPKLLDFGVASMIAEDDSEGLEQTPLTPNYAAPEQLRGKPASIVGDVYSLGVLLLELVTNGPPGAPNGQRLENDLEAIARKAANPEPDGRYPSVSHLSDDIGRYLAFEPVRARNTSWTRRCALYVRRRRWQVALVATFLIVILSGWMGSELGRRRARTEAGLGWGAHLEVKVASRVFESWITEIVKGDSDLQASVTRHLEEFLESPLRAAPEANVLVRIRLAELYAANGQWEQAEVHALQALDLAQITPGIGPGDRGRAEGLLTRIGSRPKTDKE